MNPLEQLSDYLRRTERNLRLLALARGAGLLAGSALVATVALVVAMSSQSFSDPSVFFSRLLLFFVLAAALCFGIVLPWLRMNPRRAAREAERLHPEFGQRLITFTERRNHNDPFLPLVASDALSYTAAADPASIAAPSRALLFGFAALGAFLTLMWLGMRGPGYFGYGASLLWGANSTESRAFYSISLEPGDHRVRRHSDQVIAARLNGFFARQASLFVRYASATKWEETPMQPRTDGSGFQFLLVGLPENVDYYVASNGVRSNTARLTAVDLPVVTRLRVTYHYPAYYGKKDETEDPGGDLRAVEGTVAELRIDTDKPLPAGFLVLDDNSHIDLSGTGVEHTASVPIQKDGSYHIATLDAGQTVRLSDDYFIEARRDTPPQVSILRPMRDARVSPIEEVPVQISARDDYGVLSLDLHYSVNGGPEQVRALLHSKGEKSAEGAATLSMEDFKLVPGDIVSLYATARDARTTAKSDIYFVEARPFELTYHQEQASGGEGGAQDEPKIAERQKEIIAATFNQLRSEKKDGKSEAENARYLAGVQSKLRDEAKSLSERMKSRQLASSGTAFQQFVTNMESAVAVMGPASDQLRGEKWQDALSPEQKALQYLLRAEAIFRDIRVTMGKSGGGGGGGGATRDLEGLTSLELDTQKNQYESGSQSAMDQKQKEADEALKKLEELAKRQQQLAQQQQSKQNFQQRWEQEMLRREAEQLRRKLEELTKNQPSQPSDQGQSQPGQAGQQGQQSQPGQPGEQGQESRQSQSGSGGGGRMEAGSRQQMERALENLKEATGDMSSAASKGSQPDAQRAAERLKQAQAELSGMRRQQNGSQMGDVARDAQKLAEKQASFDERLRHNFGAGASGERTDQQNAQMSGQMAEEKRRMMDDLRQLEHGMQQAARATQNTQPEAAQKLRDAISEMQQREIESRMKWTAEALGKGLGSYAVMREAPVTQALNELKDKLRGVEQSMAAQPGGESGNSPGDQAMQQALGRAEKLRRDLQAMSQGAQPGSGSVGAQGGPGPVGPALGGGSPDRATVEREYEQAARELGRLSQSARGDAGMRNDLQGLAHDAQRWDPRRFDGSPKQLAELERKLLADAEEAELILRRRLEESGGNVRTPAPQEVPPGYANAVAEYFRRLSH